MLQINRNNVNKPRRTPIIAANWKMNKTVEEALALVDEMLDDLDAYEEVETVLIPPFIALYPVVELVEDTQIKLGAQNMYHEESGAFTGEVSALMLREMCDYVIVGHSERRTLFHETDAMINLKVKAALKHDLTPIIALGENLTQREEGSTQNVVGNQLRAALREVSEADAGSVVIAYEPLWAIGSGRPANGEIANGVAKYIRFVLAELYNERLAGLVRIQYGGSVTSANIGEFMSQPEIDGALVGGASLKAADFVRIVARTQEALHQK